jgi:hypothetical protein
MAVGSQQCSFQASLAPGTLVKVPLTMKALGGVRFFTIGGATGRRHFKPWCAFNLTDTGGLS